MTTIALALIEWRSKIEFDGLYFATVLIDVVFVKNFFEFIILMYK